MDGRTEDRNGGREEGKEGKTEEEREVRDGGTKGGRNGQGMQAGRKGEPRGAWLGRGREPGSEGELLCCVRGEVMKGIIKFRNILFWGTGKNIML